MRILAAALALALACGTASAQLNKLGKKIKDKAKDKVEQTVKETTQKAADKTGVSSAVSTATSSSISSTDQEENSNSSSSSSSSSSTSGTGSDVWVWEWKVYEPSDQAKANLPMALKQEKRGNLTQAEYVGAWEHLPTDVFPYQPIWEEQNATLYSIDENLVEKNPFVEETIKNVEGSDIAVKVYKVANTPANWVKVKTASGKTGYVPKKELVINALLADFFADPTNNLKSLMMAKGFESYTCSKVTHKQDNLDTGEVNRSEGMTMPFPSWWGYWDMLTLRSQWGYNYAVKNIPVSQLDEFMTECETKIPALIKSGDYVGARAWLLMAGACSNVSKVYLGETKGVAAVNITPEEKATVQSIMQRNEKLDKTYREDVSNAVWENNIAVKEMPTEIAAPSTSAQADLDRLAKAQFGSSFVKAYFFRGWDLKKDDKWPYPVIGRVAEVVVVFTKDGQKVWQSLMLRQTSSNKGQSFTNTTLGTTKQTYKVP